MDFPDESMEWVMQSSATVEQVVDDEDAHIMRIDEDRQLELFLQVLRRAFEKEPAMDGAIAVGVVKSYELLQNLIRELKALGYFYSIRTSRDNKCQKKLIVKYPEHIGGSHPYTVDRTISFYCSSGTEYIKQMRQRLNNWQRVTTDCAATMSVKQVTVFYEVNVPKCRNMRLQTLSTVRKNMVSGKVPSRSELWVWISLPRMHHHPIILPGRQIDSEVKAAMYSLLHKGIKTGDEIQLELRRIVDEDFSRGPVKPNSDNTAFYPNQKVIYNHLRHEGLMNKNSKRKKQEIHFECDKDAPVDFRIAQLLLIARKSILSEKDGGN